MLVGMVPGVVVMEPGEKDAVRQMGWVRKKGLGGLLGGRTS